MCAVRRFAIGLAMLVLTAACNIPRDPEGTLERVTGGTLRVGITESDPWVIIKDEPTGVEVTLVEGFAKTLSADIEWVEGTEADLIGALERRELDLVIGGFTSNSPWGQKAAITVHYHEVVVVVAVPEGDDPPNDLTGQEVTVESHSETAGLVEDKGAEPNRVPEIESVEGPTALEDYRLENLEAKPTGHILTRHKHSMAAAPGENAFLVSLERYLRSRRADVPRLLQEFSQ
ncbi:MAG: transporter substrate-binding domain-containing protein [Actinobacteria bacterium]|nr:transporter substrate-binding domain-containing protein [Actinomycetota bacterium]